MTSVIAPLAEKLGVSFRSFGNDVSIVKESPVVLELNVAFNSRWVSASRVRLQTVLTILCSISLEPAPISPHDVSSSAWNLLAGSAKSTWTTSPATKGQELLFAPGLAIGNTDTSEFQSREMTFKVRSLTPALTHLQSDVRYDMLYLVGFAHN